VASCDRAGTPERTPAGGWRWSGLLAGCLVTAIAGVAAAERGPLTHTSPLTPTGELVGPGRFERTQSLAAFHHDLAIGLAERLELRLQSPGLPVPILGGALNLRASLLSPDSRLRLVLGGGLAAEWVNGADLYRDASLTVAWRGAGWSAHATGRSLEHRAPRSRKHPRIGIATAGVTVAAGPRTTLFADAGELAWLRPATCHDKHRQPVRCHTRDAVTGAMIGAWWALSDLDIGLALLIGKSGETTLPLGPLLSFRWERAL
jgi:hypothetical protein